MTILLKGAGAFSLVMLTSAAVWVFKSTASYQVGAPGVGMQITDDKVALASKVASNVVPAALPPASTDGVRAVDAYKNVQVMGHLSSGEFTRLMTAMTLWVAPNQGCAYCHAPQKDASGNIVKDEDGNPQADPNNMHSDELYAKKVARRMLQMTLHLNADWQQHVKGTGVTCFTCHRGNPVPANIWFDEPEQEVGMIGNRAGQNAPSGNAALASLPNAVFRTWLTGPIGPAEESIRVIGEEALPSANRSSIKQAEYTYSLMMHMSNALGVNCTYCHNTRSMADWSTSPPARATAYYGIRMVRDLNNEYLEPLKPVFPANRLGTLGDAPKVNCATCHQGAFKPLLGVSMLPDYQILSGPKPQPQKSVAAAADAGAADPAVAAMAAAMGADAGPGVDAGLRVGVGGGDGGAPKPAVPPAGPGSATPPRP